MMPRHERQLPHPGSNASLRGPRISVLEAGRDAGEYAPFMGQVLLVGRAEDADIGLTDPRVSRRHLEIEAGDDGWLVRDLGATNPAEVIDSFGPREVDGEVVLAAGQIAIGDALLTLYPFTPTSGEGPWRGESGGRARVVSRWGRRRPAMVMAVLGVVAIIVLVFVGVAVLFTTGGSDALTVSDGIDAGLPAAIEQRDTRAVVTSLGGDANDPVARAAADTLLRRLPEGSTVVVATGTAPTDRITYEVAIPGSPRRRVSFVQLSTVDGQMFLLPAESGQ